MRRGGRILVLLGIVLGVMTAGLVFVFLGTNTGNPPPPPQRSVVIALQNIPARSVISIDALTSVQYPEGIIPQGAFSSPQDIAGKLAIDNIYQGETILPPMIIDRSKVSGTDPIRSPASYIIPENKVAMAFQITPLSGVAGAIQPGDYVDMILTLQPPTNITQTTGARVNLANVTGTEGEAVTQLFLQDVQVINVGTWTSGLPQNQQQQQQNANIITIVIERQDATTLKSGRELGNIDLILRRAGDHKLIVPTSIEPVTREYINRRFNFKLLPPIR